MYFKSCKIKVFALDICCLVRTACNHDACKFRLRLRLFFFFHNNLEELCNASERYHNRLFPKLLRVIAAYGISVFAFLKLHYCAVAVMRLYFKACEIKVFTLNICCLIRAFCDNKIIQHGLGVILDSYHSRHCTELRIKLFFCRHVKDQRTVSGNVNTLHNRMAAGIKQPACSRLSRMRIRVRSCVIYKSQVAVLVQDNGIVSAAHMGSAADLALICIIGAQKRIRNIGPAVRIHKVAAPVGHHKAKRIIFVYRSGRVADVYFIAVFKQVRAFYYELICPFRIGSRDASFIYAVLPRPFTGFEHNPLSCRLRNHAFAALRFHDGNLRVLRHNVVALSAFVLIVGYVERW